MTSEAGADFQQAALDRPAVHTLEGDGRTLHYLDWGNSEAPALLLLHGMGGAAAEWARVAAHLQRRYHVLALDQRGHGDSSPASEDEYRTADFVGDLEAFVDAAGIAPFVLIGHSMGGHNGLAYAARHSDMLRCLVVNDIGPHLNWDRETMSGRFPDRQQPTFDSLEDYIERLRDDFPNVEDWGLITLGGARLGQRPDGRWQPKADAVAMMYWDPEDLTARLGSITCPTLIIRASGAEVISEQALNDAVAALPQGEAATMPGIGHQTFIEDEDGFFAIIDPFLERHAPGQRPPEEQR